MQRNALTTAALTLAAATTAAHAGVIVNDTSFDLTNWAYSTDAPNPMLTGGSELVFGTDDAVNGNGDPTAVIRSFATQPLNVGDKLELMAEVTIGAAYDSFKREFAIGFYALNGAPGLTATANPADWAAVDSANDAFSAVGVRLDTQGSGVSTTDGAEYVGRRAGGNSESPAQPQGSTVTPPGRIATRSIGGGGTYTVTFTVERLPDADLAGGVDLEQNVLLSLSIFGDFNSDGNPIAVNHLSKSLYFGNTSAGPLDDFDGVFFGTGENFGNGNEVDFTLDNVKVTYTPIPEPASLALLAVGGLLIGFRRR